MIPTFVESGELLRARALGLARRSEPGEYRPRLTFSHPGSLRKKEACDKWGVGSPSFGEDGSWSPLCSTCGLLCRLNETAARARTRHACSSPADLARLRVAGASSSSQRSTGGAVCPLLALAPPAVPRDAGGCRSRNQPEMCFLTAPHGSAKRTVSPHQPLSRSGSPLGGLVQACCVSVEVIRARVGAARVPFWVSFIPVMKYKPTLPRARTRAALLDSLAPAPSHAPHEIGGCDPESAQRCRWRAHHTHACILPARWGVPDFRYILGQLSFRPFAQQHRKFRKIFAKVPERATLTHTTCPAPLHHTSSESACVRSPALHSFSRARGPPDNECDLGSLSQSCGCCNAA